MTNLCRIYSCLLLRIYDHTKRNGKGRGRVLLETLSLFSDSFSILSYQDCIHLHSFSHNLYTDTLQSTSTISFSPERWYHIPKEHEAFPLYFISNSICLKQDS